MDIPTSLPTVAHAIQLSVAPVFLLTGVGSLLGVLANRLGRIVDRYRQLQTRPATEIADNNLEIASLQRRARQIHRAIRCCTICALLICTVICVLFLGVELERDFSALVAGLFVAGMLSLIGGLLCFLHEISLATLRLEALRKPDRKV